jgi:tRNA acetyltransferase TAN1
VSCVKGKEKQTVGELYDLFESLASELWPETAAVPDAAASDDDGRDDPDDGAVMEDLEKQLSKELASIKRPRKEQIFGKCVTPYCLGSDKI